MMMMDVMIMVAAQRQRLLKGYRRHKGCGESYRRYHLPCPPRRCWKGSLSSATGAVHSRRSTSRSCRKAVYRHC